MRAGWAALALAVGGCGAPTGEPPVADSTLVDVLAELHLADARAALDSTRSGHADSLRAVALAAHDLDDAALADRLDALARAPDRLRATYDLLDTRLALERQGIHDD